MGEALVGAARDLGRRVTESWRSRSFDEARFAELAADAVAQVPADQLAVAPGELVRWLQGATDLPPQRTTDLTVTLYENDRVDVGVRFMPSGLGPIHDHAFTGAARSLAGEAVQLRYHLGDRCEVNERVHH